MENSSINNKTAVPHWTRKFSCDEYSMSYSKTLGEQTSSNNSTKSSKASSTKEIRKLCIETSERSPSVIDFIASQVILLSEQEKENEKEKGLCSLYQMMTCSEFTIDGLMYYLNSTNEQGIIDTVINVIFTKYIHESFYYIPQLCSLIAYKKYNESIETYLLESCIDKMKFSVIIYWIVSANSSQSKMEELMNKIEMTLVNCQRATFSSFNSFLCNKAKSVYDVIQQSINKEIRLNYFNTIIQFYEDIQGLCEGLKEVDLGNRNDYLRKEVKALNRRINELYLQLDDMMAIDDSIRNMHRGIMLPFDDHDSVNDNDNTIIVSFIPELSACFNTKARVPVKMTVECIQANECSQWDCLIYNDPNNTTIGSKPEETSLNHDKENDEDNDFNIARYSSMDDFFNQMNILDHEKEIKNQQILNQIEIHKILKAIENENIINKVNAHSKGGSISSMATYNGRGSILIGRESKMIRENEIAQFICDFTPETINLFGDKWSNVIEKQKEKSRFRNFDSYTLKSFIAKANDDLRQEALAMQLIKQFDAIFNKAGLTLRLCPYEIIVTSSTSGLIEYLPNTISIDALKKSLPDNTSLNSFFRGFFKSFFEEAQQNFVNSLAAYSLLTYILDIKDRHNGNILIDIHGNIIHIDFGFILGISPGNICFENAPFKLTAEYMDILDGPTSPIFQYYKSLLLKGIIELRKNTDTICQIIEIIAKGGQDIPCFAGKDVHNIIIGIKNKFKVDYAYGVKNDIDLVEQLAYYSMYNWRTTQYDRYQKYTNDIRP